MTDKNQTSLSWQAPEYRHYPKNIGWYITFISVAVLVIGFFLIVESDLFGAVSLGLIALVAVLFARKTPEMVEIELNSQGIKFGNLFYPYKQLKYFWVVHNENHKTVNFHTTAMFNNTMILEIEDQDPEIIRQFLLKHLPEHSETEATAMQQIMHKIKF